MNKVRSLLVRGGSATVSRTMEEPVRHRMQGPARLAATAGGHRCNEVNYARSGSRATAILPRFQPARHFNLGAWRRCAEWPIEPAESAAVRVAVGDLTHRMTEYVVSRADASSAGTLLKSQPAREALGAEVSMAGERDFGRHHGPWHARADAAEALRRRLRVAAERARSNRGIESFTARAIQAFLQRSNILVCLLPLTFGHPHILTREMFASSTGTVRSCARPDNAGGGLQDEADILQCSTTAHSVPHRSTSSPMNASRTAVLDHPKVVLRRTTPRYRPDEISNTCAPDERLKPAARWRMRRSARGY